MTDGRLAQRRKACCLHEYDTAFRDGLFRLHENACLAHIYRACAKALLAALPVEAAQHNLAIARNTLFSPAALSFGRLRGIRWCGRDGPS
jgi:hypothetical protein